MSIDINPLPQPGMSLTWQAWASNLITSLGPTLLALSVQSASTPGAVRSNKRSPSAGQATMGSMSSGIVTVLSTLVTRTSLILITPQATPLGVIYEDESSRVFGESFVIKSTDEHEALSLAWFLLEPI